MPFGHQHQVIKGHPVCGVHIPAYFSAAEGKHGVGMHLLVLAPEQESAGLFAPDSLAGQRESAVICTPPVLAV